VRVAVCRLELMARNSQSVVFKRAIGVYDPARQNGQPFLDVGNRYFIEVEPLAACVGARELFGKQLATACIGFPRNMARRIAFMVSAQSGKVFLTASVVLSMSMRNHGWWGLRGMLCRAGVYQAA